MKNETIVSGAAVHESGHAFLRHWFSHKIEFVTVGARNSECFIRLKPEELQSYDPFIDFHCLICACSGYAAESVAGICDESEWLASRDRRRAFEFAKRLSDGDTQAAELLVEWGRRMAFVTLSAHQAKVQRLADALLKHGKLSGEQVNEILRKNRDCQKVSAD